MTVPRVSAITRVDCKMKLTLSAVGQPVNSKSVLWKCSMGEYRRPGAVMLCGRLNNSTAYTRQHTTTKLFSFRKFLVKKYESTVIQFE